MLNVKRDLIGKTITGVIAVPGSHLPSGCEARAGHDGPCEIWMMQFSDGSHIEFVSPGAKRGLRRSTGRASMAPGRRAARESAAERTSPQLALNVA